MSEASVFKEASVFNEQGKCLEDGQGRYLDTKQRMS
jgi:hypothetical protein